MTTWSAGCTGLEVHVTGKPVISEAECAAMVAEAEAWAVKSGE